MSFYVKRTGLNDRDEFLPATFAWAFKGLRNHALLSLCSEVQHADGTWKPVKTAAAVKESLQAENTTLEDTKKVLLEGYQATKREVDDALTAFNQERDFYAAAVGIPGLRTAQYVIDHMMPGRIAQTPETAFQVDIDDPVPVVVAQVQEFDSGEDTGIVDQDIDPAQFFGRIHHSDHVCRIRHSPLNTQRLATS